MPRIYDFKGSHSNVAAGRMFIPNSLIRQLYPDGKYVELQAELTLIREGEYHYVRLLPYAKNESMPQNMQRVQFRKGMGIEQATVNIKRNGHIQIPSLYREKANLSGDITFVGIVDFIEIWNSENLKKSQVSGSLEEEILRYKTEV